jgi:hypothetical protein
VPRTSSADLVEMESDQVPNIASAVTQLQAAIRDMRADGISLEFSREQGDGRSKSHFRLRAYRRAPSTRGQHL